MFRVFTRPERRAVPSSAPSGTGLTCMPKHKTIKAAVKRFKKTARGKVVYKHAGARHLLSSKTRKRKRSLRKRGVLSEEATRRIAPLLS